MGRRKKNLNEKPAEYIEKNFLEQDPEGFKPCQAEKIVIAKHIPEMKKFIFLNGRDPGYALHFHYHSKTHYLKHYTLYHGMEHELPVEVINHLENCGESQYGYRPGINGHPEMYVKSLKYNFRCKLV